MHITASADSGVSAPSESREDGDMTHAEPNPAGGDGSARSITEPADAASVRQPPAGSGGHDLSDPAVPSATQDTTTPAAPLRTGRGRRVPAKAPRANRSTQNYAAAVYGSVLAATVVISAGDLRSPLTLAVLLITSGLVFWIAHVYAATVASVHGGWHYGAIRTGMAHEWPVAFAALPPAAASLVAGLLPHVSVSDGVWAALIVALAEQQLWGYAAVRHAKLSGSALTRTMLLNVFMGFIIVALKLGVGH